MVDSLFFTFLSMIFIKECVEVAFLHVFCDSSPSKLNEQLLEMCISAIIALHDLVFDQAIVLQYPPSFLHISFGAVPTSAFAISDSKKSRSRTNDFSSPLLAYTERI